MEFNYLDNEIAMSDHDFWPKFTIEKGGCFFWIRVKAFEFQH